MIHRHGKGALNSGRPWIFSFCVHAYIVLSLAHRTSCCGDRAADVSVRVSVKFACMIVRPDRYLNYLFLQVCVVSFALKHTLGK
jgi:hypothetical protein